MTMVSPHVRRGSRGKSERPAFVAKRSDPPAQRVGPPPTPPPIDGRTLRKLRRFRVELKRGAAGERALLPFEVAVRVNFLLNHGDRIDDLRRLCRPRRYDYDERRVVRLLEEMQSVCNFRPEAYELAGVHKKTLAAAGLVPRAA